MTSTSSHSTIEHSDPVWKEWLRAVDMQDTATLTQMIERDAVKTHHYQSALHLAVERELTQSLAFLVARATDEDIHTALWRACNDGKTASLKVLLQSPRVDPNHEGAQALLGAIFGGHEDCVCLLMEVVDPVHFGCAFYEALYCQNEKLARLFYPHCDPQEEFKQLHQHFSELYQGDTTAIDAARAIMANLDAEMLHKEVSEGHAMDAHDQRPCKALKL